MQFAACQISVAWSYEVVPGFLGSLCSPEICNVGDSLLTVRVPSNKFAETITVTIFGCEKLR
jgi:hypothetical protein